jgi:hypothetical protein
VKSVDIPKDSSKELNAICSSFSKETIHFIHAARGNLFDPNPETADRFAKVSQHLDSILDDLLDLVLTLMAEYPQAKGVLIPQKEEKEQTPNKKPSIPEKPSVTPKRGSTVARSRSSPSVSKFVQPKEVKDDEIRVSGDWIDDESDVKSPHKFVQAKEVKEGEIRVSGDWVDEGWGGEEAKKTLVLAKPLPVEPEEEEEEKRDTSEGERSSESTTTSASASRTGSLRSPRRPAPKVSNSCFFLVLFSFLSLSLY